ncbi:MAG: SRPBCC family protein [Acidimicrobiia bacterium]
MPTRTFSHSIAVDAPREEVWATLQRPETWEGIGGVDRVHDALIDQEGRLQGFSFEATAAGQIYPGLATPHAREEGRVMAWAIDTSEIEGVIRVDLTDQDAGTRLTVTVELESRTILSAVFFPVVATGIENGLPQALAAFAREFGAQGQSS